MKLASSATIEGLTKLVQQYYYSPSCTIKDGKVYNSKGVINGVEVVHKKGHFIFKTV